MNVGQQMSQWQVSQWFNSPRPIQPVDLRGRIVLIHAFQMLCPGCVSHGIPQAVRVSDAFPASDLAVIGVHTVFEHHDAMGPNALAAFIHEYRLKFPIGVDQPAESGPIPVTMQQLRLQGTPSLVLLDRDGRIRLNHFGLLDDLRLGSVLGQLLAEPSRRLEIPPAMESEYTACDEAGCRVA